MQANIRAQDELDLKTPSPGYQRICSPSIETKLCIIIDSGTPIVTKVPTIPGELTLGQFKAYASLHEASYKFYFKSYDSEFGTVKEELVDDDAILPVENGRIVVWVISSDNVQSALFGSENPYGRLANNQFGHGKASPTPSSISFQQNRKGGPGTINQEPIYDQMIIDHPHCIVANLYLGLHDAIGVTVLCPSDDYNDTNGLLIDKIQPQSVASRDGRLQPGDRIVEINGVDLRSIRVSEAVTYFKQVVENKGAINLVLQKGAQSSTRLSPRQNQNFMYHSPRIQPQNLRTITNGFDPATELPAPDLETEHHGSNFIKRTINKNYFIRGTHSLPRSLTPRSLYTSSNIDNLTSSNDLRYPMDSRSVYEPTTPNSLRQISVALHCGRDTIHTIYATLKADSASLDIKDREWLKVVVKDAFLGSSLIKWLSRNVYGFCNRSEIKRYANRMLSTGLIKSPMSNATFSEKCFYILS